MHWAALLIPLLFVPQSTELGIETMLSGENAYNPVPSPDGSLIAYVATGRGERTRSPIRMMGSGRSTIDSDVELMTADGKLVVPNFLRRHFIAEWNRSSDALVCYRDWKYTVATRKGKVMASGDLPEHQQERIAFLDGEAVWISNEDRKPVLRTRAKVLTRIPMDASLLLPSPDGRYLGVMRSTRSPLMVYDRTLDKWALLGDATISPDREWDYMEPSWDPWFPDSSRLVFFSGSDLAVASPDGTNKQVVWKSNQPSGLPVASPDGKSIAFVTFERRPMGVRTDLDFWGNASISVLDLERNTVRRVTTFNPDTIRGLRWLGPGSLVFDRWKDEVFNIHTRIWKVTVSH